jgi:Fe-S oxidoreductase
MLYQMQALQVIEILRMYEVKKIITICPHCFNIFKNEYPDLGGHYEVINYLQFIEDQINNGKLTLNRERLKNTRGLSISAAVSASGQIHPPLST